MIVKADLDWQALPRVAPDCGRLVGRQDGEVSVFKGIRYAAPPVGALRWRAPQPMPRWEGEQTAFDFGPAPLQELPPRSSLLYRLNHDEPQALVMSEDCLTLNVWSPAPGSTDRLPVLVWLHGGGNRTGHGGQDLFDGRHMAERGLVVVTVNMRLGALSFLSLPELIEEAGGAAGNYGLLDVVAALVWVRDHISAFGGDPDQVTLAGNSAGSAIVTHLMAAPLARGLFGAAIGQSMAGAFRTEGTMMHADQAAELGTTVLRGMGASLKQWRDLPATAFLRIAPQPVVIDGQLLVEDTTAAFIGGRQAPIPLLAGWNVDEGSLYAPPGAEAGLGLERYTPATAQAIHAFFSGASARESAVERRALVGARRFAYPVWRWARTHAQTTGASVWVYEFAHQPPVPDAGGDYGAFHTAELPYVWDNLAKRNWAWNSDDHALAKRMADIWATFACTANPNGAGLPTWEPLDPSGTGLAMTFAKECLPKPVKLRAAFDLFDEEFFFAPAAFPSANH